MANFCLLTIAGRDIGFGHLSRCRNLASAMQADGHQVSFAVFGMSAPEGNGIMEGARVVYRQVSDLFNTPLRLTFGDDHEPDCVIADVAHQRVLEDRSACAELFRVLKLNALSLALIDGGGDQSVLRKCPDISPDAVIYPYVGPSPLAAPGCRVLAGAEYAILAPEYASVRPRQTRQHANRILISCGGSDPSTITAQLVQALLDEEVRKDLEVRIVIGPLFPVAYEDALRAQVPESRKGFQFVRHPSSLAEHMTWADIALVTSGLVKYELAATGTPAITLSIDSYHDNVNKVFSSGGSIVDLGLDHSSSSIIESVESLLADVDKRKRMSAAGRALVDGKGAVRIARELATLAELRRQTCTTTIYSRL